MAREKAVRVEHLVDVPTDKPGVFLRAERRFWSDGTSCLHIAKWGTQPSGRKSPWIPLQYLQVPWELASAVMDDIRIGLADVQGD